jgi:hypothetical protein
MTEPENVTVVTLSLSRLTMERLAAFTGTQFGPETVEHVIYELIDHAQQAVYRSGAWEREWICQALGYDWLDNLEPDPEHADIGWQRPRNDT